MTQVPLPPATYFTCPGEIHSIPRSVHIARLAGAYTKCQLCAHRSDRGLVAVDLDRGPREPQQAMQSGWVATADGIRGRYLNDLTRQDGVRWGNALARFLWERSPLVGRPPAEPQSSSLDAKCSSRRTLTVVVGYDERPSSPDLAIGAATGLRQSGCRVLDLGVVNKAIWWFAAQHLSADAGLLVTGSGHDPSWTGFDVVGRAGACLSETTDLPELVARARQPGGRMTRSAGSVATFSVLPPYLAQLRTQFHALRPLHVFCATPSPLVGRILQPTLDGLPCRTRIEVGPQWSAPTPEHPTLSARVAAAHSMEPFDIAMWISSDGQSCALFDERGERVAAPDVLRWLSRATVEDRPLETDRVFIAAGKPVVTEETVWNTRRLSQVVEETVSESAALPRSDRPWWLDLERATLSEFRAAMQRHRAAAGSDPQSRFWLGGTNPTCDALATLAAVLRALSWSDVALSDQLSDVRTSKNLSTAA